MTFSISSAINNLLLNIPFSYRRFFDTTAEINDNILYIYLVSFIQRHHTVVKCYWMMIMRGILWNVLQSSDFIRSFVVCAESWTACLGKNDKSHFLTIIHVYFHVILCLSTPCIHIYPPSTESLIFHGHGDLLRLFFDLSIAVHIKRKTVFGTSIIYIYIRIFDKLTVIWPVIIWLTACVYDG